MNIVMTRIERFVILKLQGKLEVGEGDAQLRQALRIAVTGGADNIILDLSKLSYIDSSGIGEIVKQHQDLYAASVGLCLTHLNNKVYGLFSLTRLISVLPVYDSNEDAMQLMRPAA